MGIGSGSGSGGMGIVGLFQYMGTYPNPFVGAFFGSVIADQSGENFNQALEFNIPKWHGFVFFKSPPNGK